MSETAAPPEKTTLDSQGHFLREKAWVILFTFGRAILRRWWLFAALGTLMPIGAWLYVRRLPREYMATATLRFEGQLPDYLSRKLFDEPDHPYAFLETEFRLMRSRYVAGMVAQDLCRQLITDRQIGTKVPALFLIQRGVDCANPASIEESSHTLLGLITIQGTTRNNHIVELTARAFNPELVAAVANTYASTYIAVSSKDRLAALRQQATRYQAESIDLQVGVVDAKDRLAKFEAQHGTQGASVVTRGAENAKRSVIEQVEHSKLKYEVDRLNRLAEAVLNEQTKLELASRLQTLGNVGLIDAALVPSRPIGPSLQLYLGISLGVAVLLSLLLTAYLEFRNFRIKTPANVTFVCPKVPLLGGLCHSAALSKTEDQKAGVLATAGDALLSDSRRKIRRNLSLTSPDKRVQVLVITSPHGRAGKTVFAFQLGLSLAERGESVLIVDGDLENPRLHRMIGQPDSVSGLIQVIQDEVQLAQAQHQIDLSNLTLLPAGLSAPNTYELLSSKRFAKIVGDLRGSFTRIIIDAASMDDSTGKALALAHVADGVVLVLRSRKTSRRDLVRSIDRLNEARMSLLGLVLNDLRVRRQASLSQPAPRKS